VTSLNVLSKHLLIMELRFDAMLRKHVNFPAWLNYDGHQSESWPNTFTWNWRYQFTEYSIRIFVSAFPHFM